MSHTFGEPENLVLATSDDNAVLGNFISYTKETIRDVLIQNATSNQCFVTWGTEAVPATTSGTILPGGSHLALNNVAFTYFSIVRVGGGTDTQVHITGMG